MHINRQIENRLNIEKYQKEVEQVQRSYHVKAGIQGETAG